MHIVVINGAPCAGKDTFVELCSAKLNWCLNTSTVDFVKDIARQCGWNGEKTPTNRAFLSKLKDLLTNWDDVPYKKVEEALVLFQAEMENYDQLDMPAVAFIHCREPQEIEKFKNRLGAQTLLIRREAVEASEQSNHADAEVFNYDYDITIYNNGTLEDLKLTALRFLTNELGISAANLKI